MVDGLNEERILDYQSNEVGIYLPFLVEALPQHFHIIDALV